MGSALSRRRSLLPEWRSKRLVNSQCSWLVPELRRVHPPQLTHGPFSNDDTVEYTMVEPRLPSRAEAGQVRSCSKVSNGAVHMVRHVNILLIFIEETSPRLLDTR